MSRGIAFKAVRVIGVLVLSIAAAAVLLEMKPEAVRQTVADPPRLVAVSVVRSGPLRMTIEAYGTVRPAETLKLAAEVRGRIVAMHPLFAAGRYVQQGTVLITIDPRAYRLAVERQQIQITQIRAEIATLAREIENIKASLRISAADVALARSEFDRLQALAERHATAETTRDKAEKGYLASRERLQQLENQLALTGPRMDQLRARLKMADVMRRQAELDLEHTDMIAPFNGWVLEKAVEKGQHVATGQYVGSLYRHGRYEIQVRIPAEELRWLPEMPAADGRPAVSVLFRDGGMRKTWSGRIARTGAEMEGSTRTLPLIVAVDTPDVGRENGGVDRLRPNMFVTVRIPGRRLERVVKLDRGTVRTGDVVHLAVDGRLKVQPVRVVRRFKDAVYVDRGLSDGDRIILTPIGTAADGMKIRVRDAGPADGQG